MGQFVDQLIAAGYGGYRGWGDAEAQADFNATGGSGKYDVSSSQEYYSGGGGGGDILSNAINAVASNLNIPESYDTANPFSFDEALAREASTAEYAPYYEEMLSDYTSGVEKRLARSDEDLKRTLEQLNAGKEYYLGKERRVLDKALDTTKEGYAGRGLFFSGAKDKDIKDLKTEYEADIGDYLGRYEYSKTGAELGAKRTKEDESLNKSMYTRDIEREKKYAVESGILQRKGEQLEEYEMGRRKYYESKGIYG